ISSPVNERQTDLLLVAPSDNYEHLVTPTEAQFIESYEGGDEYEEELASRGKKEKKRAKKESKEPEKKPVKKEKKPKKEDDTDMNTEDDDDIYEDDEEDEEDERSGKGKD